MSFVELVRHIVSLFDIKQGSLWNPLGNIHLAMDIADNLIDLWIAATQVANPFGATWDQLIGNLAEELKEYDFPSDTKASHLSSEELILYQAVQAVKAKVTLAAKLSK